MVDKINLIVNDASVLRRLRDLQARLTDRQMATAYREIGADLVESTLRRFETSTGPDGKPWAPLAEGTVLAVLARVKGAYGKRGLTKKGATAKAGRKPLVDTGVLRDTLRYQLIPGGVEIGTNRFSGEWEGGAAVHQFGSRNGHIPARPFLGVSADDKATVLGIFDRYLRQSGA